MSRTSFFVSLSSSCYCDGKSLNVTDKVLSAYFSQVSPNGSSTDNVFSPKKKDGLKILKIRQEQSLYLKSYSSF